MESFTVAYSTITPMALGCLIDSAFGCSSKAVKIDKDHYKFSVYFCHNLEELEDVMAEFTC